MHGFNALCLFSLHIGVYLLMPIPTVFAQTPPPTTTPTTQTVPTNEGELPGQPPIPPATTEFSIPGSDGVSPQLNRYLLGPGDVLGVQVQRPPGRYRIATGDVIAVSVQRPPGRYLLGPGDAISVAVQRFPDLSFQAQINPEGNITVPLLGTVSLKGLSLQGAQTKIRGGLNRYVVEPIVTLSLVAQRPDINFQTQINPEGNVNVPQLGAVKLQGLSLEEAQKKVRAGVSTFLIDPVVSISVVAQRPDLSFQAQINPEGNINVPQLGSVAVQGLTLEEAQEKVRLGLNKILVEPVVSVLLANARQVQITIGGEVFKPGIYPIASATPRITDALLIAGGAMGTGDLRIVQVRRKLFDGTVVSQNIDLYSPLLSGGGFPNLRLQDGDTIVIPKREVGTDDGYDRNLVARSSFAQPQIRIRVLNYAAGGIVTVPLPNGSTFIDALAGINPDNANLREIALVRFDQERGKAVTQRLDGKKALAGDATQNVALQDNDVIVVGRNLIGKITNALGTITRPFFDVQNFLRFFQVFGGGTR
jgi:polysaccharide biosynthesis/export protein